jgi:hypothetical protein
MQLALRAGSILLAEGEGFEPPWGNRPQLISNQRRLAAPASLLAIHPDDRARNAANIIRMKIQWGDYRGFWQTCQTHPSTRDIIPADDGVRIYAGRRATA